MNWEIAAFTKKVVIMAPVLRTLAAGLVFASYGTVFAQNSPSCTCRHQGIDFQLGEEVCLNGPSGPSMARCEMLLNNTSWKFINLPCPEAWTDRIPPPTESVSMNFEVTDTHSESVNSHQDSMTESDFSEISHTSGSLGY